MKKKTKLIGECKICDENCYIAYDNEGNPYCDEHNYIEVKFTNKSNYLLCYTCAEDLSEAL